VNIVHFEMNAPVQMALQSPQGTIVQGRYGDRVMFQLADGRVMYVPPIVAGKIESHGIAAGERFELCKARLADGRRRSVEWRVKRLDPEHDSQETPDTQLEAELRASAEIALAKKSQLQLVNGNGNGSGHAPSPNEAGSLAPSTKLEHALKTAISAAYSAEKFGAELGYVVRFDSDAIKSMAITVLINMSDGGRR
jgi:hypothetical protein